MAGRVGQCQNQKVCRLQSEDIRKGEYVREPGEQLISSAGRKEYMRLRVQNGCFLCHDCHSEARVVNAGE